MNQKSKIKNQKSPEWLEIGKIVAAQGIKGEVRVYPDSDFPERFVEPGPRWLRHPGEEEPQPIQLLQGRYLTGKGLYVVQFAGVENRDRAEAMRGCILLVPASDRPPLEEDEYHVQDLIGLSVFNQLTGETVGTVVDIISAGNDLLVVSTQLSNDKEILIPFVKEIVPVVDLETGRIEITPPPGLLEI